MLNLKQESHTSQNPFGRSLLGFQVKCPDMSGSPLPGCVHRALVEVPELLLVLGDRLDEDYRHGRVQLLQSGLCYGPLGGVPPGTL